MTVMIADDNARMRQVIRRMLEASAEEIYECCNGMEAVAMYAERRPDWVLMDIVMDTMDGLSAAKAITETHPNANILIITQHDEPRLREEAERSGAKGYILKERLDEIIDIVR